VTASDLITPAHRQRRAVIYVRQSTPQQVLSNTESQRLQYALRQRAEEYGWAPSAVDVIDADLGQSGRSTEGRVGFAALVARVDQGLVGVIFAYDATRLSRNCTDWYHLLDLCGLRRCLIGDKDGVYDPASINGRLLLGLKGQISELEAFTIKARLTAGLRQKARRGELVVSLPVGLVRDPAGRVVKHPNVGVTERIDLVFATFTRLRTVQGVVREFRDAGLTLPRREFGAGAAAVVWRRPTSAAVTAFLRNPAYAGTYTYGRTEFRPSRPGGPSRKHQLSPAQWQVCLPDKYPAYIARATFETNQAVLRDNYQEYRTRMSRGVPRSGAALLQGIAYCGVCGHKLTVEYQAQGRYLCNAHKRTHAEAKECQRLPMAEADGVVTEAFWEALEPAEFDRYDAALAAFADEEAQRNQARRRQREQLQYEARLAEKQYRLVDPENRLVAAELERRWNESLEALQAAEAAGADPAPPPEPIDADLRGQIADVRNSLPQLWATGAVSNERKKAIVRTLIDKVVLKRPAADRMVMRIVWVGGAATTVERTIPVLTYAQLSNGNALAAEVVRRARQGDNDGRIAHDLTAAGFRTPRGGSLTTSIVAALRRQHRVDSPQTCLRRDGCPGWITLLQVSERIGENTAWVTHCIRNGRIRITKDPYYSVYLFPDEPPVLRKLKEVLRSERPYICVEPRVPT
jgi:DNA invertase Pin-like site-specific DNA recombinase